MERREICREYLAAVCGKTDACGTVSVPIGRKEGSAIQRIPDPDHGEAAATRYERLLYNKNTDLSLLRLRLETGRTHQIRAQFAAAGHPLLGDGKYGSERENRKYGRHGQALYSYKLEFRFTTDAGPLGHLNGRSFQVEDVDFVSEYFPHYQWKGTDKKSKKEV